MGVSHKCMRSYCTPEYSLQSSPHKKLLEVIFTSSVTEHTKLRQLKVHLRKAFDVPVHCSLAALVIQF